MWSEWTDINIAKLRNGPFHHLGIYQIRIINNSNEPIAINRINNPDDLGILYIGRSGYNIIRSIDNRIREFLNKQHSGGITYSKAKPILDNNPVYCGHNLQVRVKNLNTKAEIKFEEANEIEEYFLKYAELPPCNSSKPKILLNIDI